ncbi:hypothetical protein SNL152K_6136 [Streptomyces sp. NL15-2K]|nr:hypothetical protein SNL152K_6136 [Streptomyces sp. NL15-2K]
MPACAQRSPSEALSPSAGPCWDRPTAISSDVWLRSKLHGAPGRPQSASEHIPPFARCHRYRRRACATAITRHVGTGDGSEQRRANQNLRPLSRGVGVAGCVGIGKL